MITNELINEIRNKINIVDIISNYVPLTKRGKNYFGVCPFHDDHSPSMSVSFEKQIYRCFSCGASGNVFTFVSEYEHIGFYDAVKLLGNKVGYNLSTSNSKVKTNNDYLDIYELACKFYQNSLNSNLGKNALEYLENRKLDKDTIKKFRIGLSIGKVSLTDYLISKKYSLDKLIKLGISNEKGTDLFVNRIMFPLYDLSGNVIAFSGRIYNTHDPSKYINTKETEIFKKGTILYNYHNAKDTLKKRDSVIVMEGFMDVIRASSVGINNCVATMGTAFTKEQAMLLKKITDNIILCFDGDEAGNEATLSAIEVLKEFNINPRIIRLPEGLDPDEYILKYGVDKFKLEIENNLSVIEYKMNTYKNNKNFKDLNDISTYIDESIKELSYVNDKVLIELTLKKLESEFNISYDTLYDKYLKYLNKKEVKKEVIKKKELTFNKYEMASRYLIYYMLKDENVLNVVHDNVTYFKEKNIRGLYSEIIYYYHKYGKVNIADMISYFSDKKELLDELMKIINMDIKEEYSMEEINDYIKVVNYVPVEDRIKELNIELKKENDPLRQANILSEIMKLKGVGK